MQKYMYVRNMIAHQYGKIELKRLYDIIENKNVFTEFCNEIKKYLSK